MHQFDGNLQANSHLGRHFARDLSILHQSKGIILTLLAILFLEYLDRGNIIIFDHSRILAIVIIYTIFTGGLVFGFISSLISILYSFHSFSLSGHFFTFSGPNLTRIIVCSMTLMISFIIGCYIHQRFHIYYLEMEYNKRKYDILFNNVNDAVFLYTLDKSFLPSGFINANSAALNRLGISMEELLSLSPLEIIGDLSEETIGRIFTTLKKDRYSSVETVYLTKTGEEIPIQITFQAFEYNGEWIVMSIVRNLRDEKKVESLELVIEEKRSELEETLLRDQLKTEFFSDVSHELRTPINVIFSTLQLFGLLIEEHIVHDKQNHVNKYIHIMKQNCYRLLRLINNIIDISKIDYGFFELELKNQDIVHLIESITLSVAEYIENQSLDLIFDTDVEEKIIACDPDKIERIILNLLSNAVKFTPRGGHIVVRLQDEREQIKVVVSDSGVGIPRDKINILFNRFKQANRALTKDQPGSGIGLSLVKSFVELHDGTIAVESQPGQGTVFTFTLPAQQIESSEAAITSEINEPCGHIETINVEFSDIYT